MASEDSTLSSSVGVANIIQIIPMIWQGGIFIITTSQKSPNWNKAQVQDTAVNLQPLQLLTRRPEQTSQSSVIRLWLDVRGHSRVDHGGSATVVDDCTNYPSFQAVLLWKVVSMLRRSDPDPTCDSTETIRRLRSTHLYQVTIHLLGT
ncbi:hypothetical protein AVEN_83567-1 [Araneus ventricosus]|uniref:Uncharacterized protein n=1 Tax=Araneus ventricosus TaxID=182803 RepID=A0A4Y2LE29_ARAVE|nr:hypothetical protein AVEN_83567-1 [Araneus ventricosus]